MKTLRYLAYSAAAVAYVLMVLGAVVRITGSGLGCGDDWPLCNGRLIPPLDDFRTVLEWSHRQAAVMLSILTVAVAAQAFRIRNVRSGSDPGGTLRPAIAAIGLLIAQVMLGAVTVWLELPASVVVLHWGVALLLVASLLVTAFRATDGLEPCGGSIKTGAVTSAAALAAAVLLFGSLTANLGAGPSCLGFPLCNGQLWPTAGNSGLPHIHWTHRLLAYALFLHLLGVNMRYRKADVPPQVKQAVWLAFAATGLQIVVGALMVLALLPPVWRAAHVAVGVCVWMVLVYSVWLVTDRPRGELAT
jgi:heme A synthase